MGIKPSQYIPMSLYLKIQSSLFSFGKTRWDFPPIIVNFSAGDQDRSAINLGQWETASNLKRMGFRSKQ